MAFSKIYKFLKNTAFLLLIAIFLTSCGNIGSITNPKEPVEPDARKRARKNAEEGRGIVFGGKKRGGTNYEFASSNPLWRASLDTLDFMPLALANYSGGIIVTDWYNDGNSDNEAVKISIRFLSNEIRSDAIDVDVFYKKCLTPSNCSIKKQDGQLKKEITKQILAKASIFKKQSKDKNFQPYIMGTPGE